MTSPLTAAGQYASAVAYLGKQDSNLASSGEDSYRVRAYKLYEDFYHNRPDTFKVFLRGVDDESSPIYIPSAKKMIEATNRFLAKDFNYVVSPRKGERSDQQLADMFFSNLFKREELYKKFATNRRYGLIRGDALWHITADPTKPKGKRISVHQTNPSNFFLISDPDDLNRHLGCHIVDFVQDPNKADDRTARIVRRQTYLRANAVLDSNGGYYLPLGAEPGGWTSELTFWEIGKWDDRYIKKADLKEIIVPATKKRFNLPPLITAMPVYHWRNNEIPEMDFGMSQVAGVETLINGINQSITDEDLTLVMQGLGMYATDASPPKNEDGTDGEWVLGPRIVAEVGEGNFFNRVTGVSTVAPMLEHMKFLQDNMGQSLGIPDIAQGRVDVAVAESGISLSLQLAPIIASNADKELEILGVSDHMFYDLVNGWIPTFEDLNFPGVSVSSVVGDPMPINREARIQEILLLQASGLITIAQAQAKLSEFGYEFQQGDDIKVVQEAAALAAAQSGDPFKNRASQETEPDPDEWSKNIGVSSQASAAIQGTGMPTAVGQGAPLA